MGIDSLNVFLGVLFLQFLFQYRTFQDLRKISMATSHDRMCCCGRNCILRASLQSVSCHFRGLPVIFVDPHAEFQTSPASGSCRTLNLGFKSIIVLWQSVMGRPCPQSGWLELSLVALPYPRPLVLGRISPQLDQTA